MPLNAKQIKIPVFGLKCYKMVKLRGNFENFITDEPII